MLVYLCPLSLSAQFVSVRFLRLCVPFISFLSFCPGLSIVQAGKHETLTGLMLAHRLRR